MSERARSIVLKKTTDLKGLVLEHDSDQSSRLWVRFRKKDKSYRVMVAFPKMHAPFASCKPYQASKKQKKGERASKKRKTTVHKLTVDFEGEKKEGELTDFRKLIISLETALTKLARAYDKKQGKKWGKHDDVEEHMGPLIRPDTKVDSNWPDKMTLKFDPALVTFKDMVGNTIPESTIEFDNVDVEPVAELKDLWRYEGKYFPRLFMSRCTVYPHGTDFDDDGDDDDDDDNDKVPSYSDNGKDDKDNEDGSEDDEDDDYK